MRAAHPLRIRSIGHCHHWRWVSVYTKSFICNLPLSCEEQDSVVAPEWHDNTGTLIDGQGFHVCESSTIPDSQLTIAHLAESRSRDSAGVTHPSYPGSLHTSVSLSHADRLATSPRVEHTNFTIAAGSDQKASGGIKFERLNSVGVATKRCAWAVVNVAQVEQLHSVLASGTCKDIGSGGVKHDLSNFPWRSIHSLDGVKVNGLPVLHSPSIKLMAFHLENRG